MKKMLLFLIALISMFNALKSQTWGPVPGWQEPFGSPSAVVRYQNTIWAGSYIGIRRYDGSVWQITNSGFTISNLGCLYSDGVDLYAGGLFVFPTFQALVIKWNGTLWLPVAYTTATASGVSVKTILKTSTNLYIGGFFNSIGSTPNSLSNFSFLAKYNGSIWTQPFSFSATGCAASVESIQKIGDSIYVGGGFSEISGIWTPGTFKFKDGDISPTPLDGYAFCGLARDYVVFQNNLYVGGIRHHDTQNIYVGLAKRVDNTWHSLSSDMQLNNTRITKLLGQLYISGPPSNVNGVTTNLCYFDGVDFMDDALGISSPDMNVYPSVDYIFADTIENKLYASGSFLQSFGNIADNFAVKTFTITPVHLSSFSTTVTGSNVLINWRDETPEEGIKFDVQISTDGRNFHSIGQVTEHQNKNNYSFIYPNKDCGKLFFRLNFDNNKFSSIQQVSINCNISISSDGRYLRIQTEQPGKMVILNNLGQTLSRYSIPAGYKNIELDIIPGIFFVKFIDEKGNTLSKKIFIQ